MPEIYPEVYPGIGQVYILIAPLNSPKAQEPKSHGTMHSWLFCDMQTNLMFFVLKAGATPFLTAFQ